jgi:hypothetical protein
MTSFNISTWTYTRKAFQAGAGNTRVSVGPCTTTDRLDDRPKPFTWGRPLEEQECVFKTVGLNANTKGDRHRAERKGAFVLTIPFLGLVRNRRSSGRITFVWH